MDTISLWEKISARQTTYPELTSDKAFDVVIIGGGITGVTAALELVNAGKKVALIEAEQIGGVTTGYSTGNLYIPVQPFYQHIESKFNFEVAKTIAHSRRLAMDYIERQVSEHQIACQFHRRPWYGYTQDHERISLAKEVELFQKMGIEADYVNDLPLALDFKKAIKIDNQARLNPLQYVISLAETVAKKGCQIFENSRVISVNEKDGCIVKTNKATIKAQKALIATHTPIGINHTQLFTAPYRSYVVAVTLKDNVYPEGHFWDLDRPPHATCTHAYHGDQPELLMVAGSHHRVGQNHPVESYDALEKFLRQHFAVDTVEFKWSAQHYQTADNVPYIGRAHRTSKHTYMATGYFADGLVYGTLAGMMMANMMFEEPNELANTYCATRSDYMKSLPFVVKENSNVFLQYLKDNLFFFDKEYHSLKAGEGKVVNLDNEARAVSRDENNQLHIVSAVCTHMKCIVNWNDAEKTWDCPCHGSRFTPKGQVIEGPAVTDLDYKKQEV